MSLAPETQPDRAEWRWNASDGPNKAVGRLAWVAGGLALLLAGLIGGPALGDVFEAAPEIQREQLIAGDAPYTTARLLHGTAADVDDLRGDVIWCPEKAEGWVRVVGLPRNDIARSHYQLWVLDEGRNSSHPVPAGRFDVAAGQRNLVVALEPGLPLVSPSVIVVTREDAEGAVVPDPESMLLVASLR